MEVNNIHFTKVQDKPKENFFLNVALNQAVDTLMYKVIFTEY